MCDRLFPRSGKRCARPPSHILQVEMTGEAVLLCDQCAHLYEQGVGISYAAKDGKRWT